MADAATPTSPAAGGDSGKTDGVRVFHSGALGDSILIWPLLRALRAVGRSVTLVARGSHAALAAAELGVIGVDIESTKFVDLWVPSLASSSWVPKGNETRTILTFLADDSTAAGRIWHTNAASAFPAATIQSIGPPGSASRLALWREARADTLGRAPARANPTGPIVLHVGAGSRAKRWPLDRWLTLADSLRDAHPTTTTHLLAGHVEHEQFSPDEQTRFLAHRGRFIFDDLPALAATLRAARLFLGADSGPTHLAAQLGIPTLALFGPTDPGLWQPIGPAVTVLAPPRPTADMHWLDVAAVVTACDRRMASPGPAA